MEEETKTFTSHVLNFDDATKSQLLNISQYVTLAILPVVALNKGIQAVIPTADEQKGTFEIVLELVGQVVVLFIGMFFIHRLVTFVPSYSGIPYPDVNMFTPVLTFLVIVLSIQSKVGDKANILYNRLMDILGYGETNEKHQDDNTSKANIKTTQPIHGTPMNQQMNQLPSHDMRSDIPPPQTHQGMQPQMNQEVSQYTPPPPDAQPQPQMNEPIAANDALGGFGGVAF